MCRKAAGRTVETFQDFLPWPATGGLFLPEVKKKKKEKYSKTHKQ